MVTNMMVLEPLEELWATSFIGLLFSVTEVHFDSNVFFNSSCDIHMRDLECFLKSPVLPCL